MEGKRIRGRLIPALIALPLLSAAAAWSLFPAPAWAQQFPTKPVRIIVPSAPGGAIDANARIVGGKLQEIWGQPVVVENRAGASMRIGAEAVAKAPPDGYSLLVAHDGTMSMNPVVFESLPYDPQKSFAPLSLFTQAPLVAMVHPSTGFNSIRDVVAYARANPGKLNHASGGSATLLALELFNALADTNITSVPYKGAAPAFASLMAGETQISFGDIGSAAATLKSGKVKVLGIATLQRSKLYPDWPTIEEQGVKGYETRTWFAGFAPAGTPRDIVAKIGDDMRKALADPDVRQRFQGMNLEVVASSAEELAKVVRDDTQKWARLVKERNIKITQ
jgi:tripartite-type tricarboxylate transporter receptor subunit TctC